MATETIESPVSQAPVSQAQTPQNSTRRGDNETMSTKTAPAVNFHHLEPITTGFLLKYCDAHYCSENMRFLTTVDRFRDSFYLDRAAWPRAYSSIEQEWKQIDIEQQIVKPEEVEWDLNADFVEPLHKPDFIPEETWPSKTINREAIREFLVIIWDTFLAMNSNYWICMPSWTLTNTIKRMKLIHIYGPDCFEEALVDPEQTVQVDIYPRFVLSEEFRTWKRCQASWQPVPPPASKLRLPKPPSVIFSRYSLRDLEHGNVMFTLQDLIDDRTLYVEFAKFLEMNFAIENLYCVRAIAIFREAMAEKNSEKLSFEVAWTVFRFFVATSCAYEISINFEDKKALKLSLASPVANMFDVVEQSALVQLKNQYQRYIMTKEYARLAHLALEQKKQGLIDNNSYASHSIGQHSMTVKASANGKNTLTSANAPTSSSSDSVKNKSSSSIVRMSCFPPLV
jgi:hypothetical protein